ncbi:MAG TPA: AarF/UbiB family protein [Acidimicrobiales bacterium]|nr:AarF/UbiB family protein [Acidimicrobiales bacterium]
MGILPSRQSARLSRHADVLRLVIRHARPGLLDQAGLEAELQDLEAAAGDPEAVAADAERFATDLETMGPTFVKLGQVLSTRADLLPQPYLDALVRLQDEVEPVPAEEIRQVIEDELGMRVHDVFDAFDDTPLAAASIAQVHRARLGDGTEVVVKVQRPGIAKTVRDDLEVLADVAKVVDATTEVGRRFAFVDFLDSFRTSFVAELDFRTEADNLHTFEELLSSRPHLSVPRPIDRLVTRRMLTMTYVEGRRVTDLTPLARHDFDGATLADELVRAYIDQILIHGLVHADPHPGNVLLTPEGDLVLLDLGMVARLGHRMRQHMLDLTLAIADQRADHVVEVLEAAGTRLADYDRSTLEAHVAELLSRHAGSSVATLDTGSVLLQVSRACGLADLRPPAEIAMVGKALLHLDEVTRCLDPDFVPNETIVDHSGALLRHQVSAGASQIRVARTALDTARFMENLPRHADRVLSDLAEGTLTIRVDALDEDELLRGLEKVATRLTAGIVLAAMLIGAALAMRVESDVELLGAPAVAVVFFALAFIGGLVLLGHVLVTDRRDRAKRRRRT